MKKKEIEKRKNDYIKEVEKTEYPPADRVLRAVRYILQTGEGENVMERAKEVMGEHNQNKIKSIKRKLEALEENL